ncbi:hypothetical protein QR680_009933 [Steinernema hermaphroditum]|uniref:Uncharacterized protein n=1 Tax=Steinernema hermaphroditum TaxID=289476 RepID=A0AA39INH5_9BILA|nr:hypothetical protein QR680_009933 [Steinernema hermaphroditum]
MSSTRAEYVAVAVCNIAVFPVCLPLYLLVLWIGSIVRFGYLTAVPIFTFLLALNRLIIILRLPKSAVSDLAFKILVIGTLILVFAFPILLMIAVPSVTIAYTLQFHGYVYYASALFNTVWVNIQVTLELLSLCGYFLIAIAIKKIFHTSFKISSMEVLLIVQGFLLTVPLTIVNLIGWRGNHHIMAGRAIYLCWALLAALVPAINLSVYVGFNPFVRSHLVSAIFRKGEQNPSLFIRSNGVTSATQRENKF